MTETTKHQNNKGSYRVSIRVERRDERGNHWETIQNIPLCLGNQAEAETAVQAIQTTDLV